MAVGKDKRRIFVTVPVHVADAINKLAEDTGVSASSLCGQMLTEAMPAFQQLRRAVLLARSKQASAFEVMGDMLSEVISKASQTQLSVIEERQKLTKRPKRIWVPGEGADDEKA